MRCDLHVHTVHSGMCTVPVASRFCRESFNDPVETYHALKRRGMDLVTITDHDSAGSAEELGGFADFFPGEEVSITMPSGTRAHMAVFDVTPARHVELQRRRDDLPRLLAYLHEERLVFGVNHLFSSLTGPRRRQDFDWFEHHFPVWEARNGAMHECANELSSALAAQLGKPVSGGSDSHTPRTLGLTYTEVPDARSVGEFLDGLRSGKGRVAGAGDHDHAAVASNRQHFAVEARILPTGVVDEDSAMHAAEQRVVGVVQDPGHESRAGDPGPCPRAVNHPGQLSSAGLRFRCRRVAVACLLDILRNIADSRSSRRRPRLK